MQEKKIIFGAPGCGKTTYLLNILEEELKTVKPKKIAFVSFTRKGVYEGLDRALKKFDLKKKDFPYFRTLHSICFKAVKASKYDMLSATDYKRFSKLMNMKFVGYYTEEFYHNDDRYLYLHFLRKNNFKMYEQVRDALQQNVNKIKHVSINYTKYKQYYKKRDFTDLLEETLKRKIHLDIDVAIIDEAQDLTTLQWQVCESLFARAKRVYIAGDDDQAIYEWTGADVNKFLSFNREDAIILDKSWRLKRNLLDFAKQISAMIDNRVDKNFEPAAEGGGIYYHNSIKDFKFNDNETYYCLSRNNAFLVKFRDELRKQIKVFKYKTKLSVDKDVVFAINHFKHYKDNVLSPEDRLKIDKILRKDIDNVEQFEWYEVFKLTAEESFYYRKLIENKVHIPDEPNITVGTIHSVKGGEADNVVLLLDVTKVVYNQLFNLSDSELRVLYVACTRAKNNLHIVHSTSRHGYDEVFKEVLSEHNI